MYHDFKKKHIFILLIFLDKIVQDSIILSIHVWTLIVIPRIIFQAQRDTSFQKSFQGSKDIINVKVIVWKGKLNDQWEILHPMWKGKH